MQPLDLSKLKVYPLAERKSLTRADEILIDPDSEPKPCPEQLVGLVQDSADKILAARRASVHRDADLWSRTCCATAPRGSWSG